MKHPLVVPDQQPIIGDQDGFFVLEEVCRFTRIRLADGDQAVNEAGVPDRPGVQLETFGAFFGPMMPVLFGIRVVGKVEPELGDRPGW